MSDSSLYQTDFVAWIHQQQVALNNRDVSSLDWENLDEELDAMGIREKNELKNGLVVLLAHLLKWEHQPRKRSISWFTTMPLILCRGCDWWSLGISHEDGKY